MDAPPPQSLTPPSELLCPASVMPSASKCSAIKAAGKLNICSVDLFCRAILFELGLQGKLTTDQLAKKWDNLKRRYKVNPGPQCRLMLVQLSFSSSVPPPGAEVSLSRRGHQPKLLALVLPHERRHGGTLLLRCAHPHSHSGGRRR